MKRNETDRKPRRLPKWLYVVAIVAVIGIANRNARFQQARENARSTEMERRFNQTESLTDNFRKQADPAMHPRVELETMRSPSDSIFDGMDLRIRSNRDRFNGRATMESSFDDMDRKMDAMHEEADRMHHYFLTP